MTIFQLDLHRIALLGIMFCAVPAAAQFPEKFTNLQVLPKDISRKQLESTMRGFAFALNVWPCRLPCEKPNAKKFEMDFASDAGQCFG
jgi:cytochrome c biogenesis protein CcdA